MSEMAEAFVELLDANDEACGTPQFVLVNGEKKRAIIEDITTDEIIILGGNAESGGFRAKCLKSEFADVPEQGDPIVGRGKELQVMSVLERNGVEYEIVAGDPVSEDS